MELSRSSLDGSCAAAERENVEIKTPARLHELQKSLAELALVGGSLYQTGICCLSQFLNLTKTTSSQILALVVTPDRISAKWSAAVDLKTTVRHTLLPL